MADNITLSAAVGVGVTVATDEIAGKHFPKQKMTLGNDDQDGGTVSVTNPMPVDVKNQPIKVISENLIWGAGTAKVSVGVMSTLIIAANASRAGAVFVNDSPNVIYLRVGDTAVLNEGIRLNPNGGAYEINNTNLSTLVVNAISAVAASNLTFQEAT